jgi:hypothetical protein
MRLPRRPMVALPEMIDERQVLLHCSVLDTAGRNLKGRYVPGWHVQAYIQAGGRPEMFG